MGKIINEEIAQQIAKRAKKIIENKDVEILNDKKYTKSERNQIYSILDDYDQLSAVSLGEEGKKKILLRYHEETPDLNRHEKIIRANDLYREGKYEECINELRPMLYSGKTPHFIFQKIGISYMRLGKTKKAIKFLTIANEASNQIDLDSLITKLKNKENTSNISTSQQSFKDYRDDEYYGIENFDSINDYIQLNKTDVETACRAFNMSEEDTNLVKLIYAKMFYIQSNADKGDQFLKSVERDKNKTNKVKTVYQIIVNNRRLYLRKPTPARMLSLQIKPQ